MYISKLSTKNEGSIAKEPHGYIKRTACIKNLLKTLDVIIKSLFEDFTVDEIYLDFFKMNLIWFNIHIDSEDTGL